MAISPKLTSHYVRFPSALLIICLSLFLIIPATLQGRERGELLRVVRDADGTPVRLYWATYPFTRRPQVFGLR